MDVSQIAALQPGNKIRLSTGTIVTYKSHDAHNVVLELTNGRDYEQPISLLDDAGVAAG